jgi:iron complex outermembrane receptor protein
MLTANTDNPQSRVPGYATTDFHVSFFTPDTRWQFDIFGSNVTNTHYYVSTTAQVLSSIMPGVNNTATGATIFRGSLGDPARFGARLTAKF